MDTGPVPPHALCVLAHPDKTLARQVLRRLRDELQMAPRDRQHRLTLLFFEILKKDTDAFADEGLISTELLFWMRRFKLVKVTERSIERPHAQMTRAAANAPHHGPVFMSFKLRSPEIKQRLQEQSSFLFEFSKCCDAARGQKALAKTLGVAGHPLLAQSFLRQTYTNEVASLRRRAFVSVLFQSDPRTQYERYPAVAKLIKQHTEKAKSRKQFEDGTEISAVARCMAEHFQTVCAKGAVCSFPASSGSKLKTLEATIHKMVPPAVQATSTFMDDADVEQEFVEHGAVAEPDILFFQIVDPFPGRKKGCGVQLRLTR